MKKILLMMILFFGVTLFSTSKDVLTVKADVDPANDPNYFGPITTETIYFQSTYIPDDTMSVGSQEVVNYGQYGERKRYIHTGTGEMVWVIVKEPVPQTVRSGIRPTHVTSYDPYVTRYVADENMTAGETIETQEGQLGTLITTTYYEVNPATGEVMPIREEKEVGTERKDHIYTVGTKPVLFSEEIEFTTSYIMDDSMEEGVRIVERRGVKGERSYRITFALDERTGEVTPDIVDSSVLPIDEIIRIGTKKRSEGNNPNPDVSTVRKVVPNTSTKQGA